MSTNNHLAQSQAISTLDLLLRQFDNRVLLSLDDLASATGLSKSTLYKRTHLLRRGHKRVDLPRLSSSDDGRLIQVNIIDLATWLENKREKPQSSSIAGKKRKGRPTKTEQVSRRTNK